MVEPATVIGRVRADTGTASKVMPELVMDVIRRQTGFPRLRPGTLNVKVEKPHAHRKDYTLLPADRPDRYREVWYFELCRISRRQHGIRALILRTAANYHGDCVLEIMAEEQLRSWLPVIDGEEVEVTIFTNLNEARKALESK
jgi:CTP-dependent riboflavin kinase